LICSGPDVTRLVEQILPRLTEKQRLVIQMAFFISRTRHQAQCSIRTHPQRREIEGEFVNWASPYQMAARLSSDPKFNLPARMGYGSDAKLPR
jgi:hypothetical protein